MALYYNSGRVSRFAVGVPGFSTDRDLVLDVSGALGIGTTQPRADADVPRISVRNQLLDRTGFAGSVGYYLANDIEGIKWVESPPIISNAILVLDNDVIVGLGLNINEVDFPALLKEKVTSISIEIGQSFDVLELMFKYIKNLEQYYLLLKANKAVAISEQYESVLLGRGVKSSFIHSSGERFEGIIQGVDHAGKLMVLKEGETSFFQNKEIQFIIN